jgi:hypothetical protein
MLVQAMWEEQIHPAQEVAPVLLQGKSNKPAKTI